MARPKRKREADGPRDPTARGTATAQAIITATAQIIASRGLEAFTVRAVAERAGVGMGSLYQFFPTRDALIVAWREQLLMGEVATALEEISRSAGEVVPLADIVRRMIPLTLNGFRRVMDACGPDGVNQFAARFSVRDELGRRMEEPLANLLEHGATPGVVRKIRYREGARLVIRTVCFIVHDAILFPPSDEAAYLDELAEMVIRYLCVNPP